MYGLRFGYDGYFFRGTALTIGEFNTKPFICHGKSGGQNLWLPFKKNIGLKLFHPKGFSGTLEKAKKHFKAQNILAEEGLAPKPLEMWKIALAFVKVLAVVQPWECYGIMMRRVLSGGVPKILRNLESFGVRNNEQVHRSISSFVSWYGLDALTLNHYMILSRYFGVEETRSKIIFDEMRLKIPSVFSSAPDLLSWSNIALDEKGEAKVIDCDLSGI